MSPIVSDPKIAAKENSEIRVAFLAEFSDAGPVVCLASEECISPILEEQSGEFETWTEAHAFAAKLNEALHISREDVEQIVLSAKLAKAEASRGAGPAASRRWRSIRARILRAVRD